MSQDKTVLITGAAKRIGRELALSFAEKGWNIAVHYNQSEEEAVDLYHQILKNGKKSCLVQADLFKESEVRSLLPQATKKIGPIDLLINNASVFLYDSVTSTTKKSWDQHMDINLWAPFVLSQDFANQTIYGSIINVLDQRVWNLTPHYMSYTISKVGLWTLTQTLALALAPSIRVNAIGPGPVLKNDQQTDQQFDTQCRNLPLQQVCKIEDICSTAHFLAENTSITGQMIAVDGGQHLGWSFPSDTRQRED